MLLALTALALLAIGLFMTLGARGSWAFVLSYRGTKLAAIVLVGHAIAVSTVLFQTISANRILTPSIMGFDWLYRLLQTALVFSAGAAFTVTIDSVLLFAVETAILVGFACLLYGTLLSSHARDIHRLLLIGFVLGVLFRSLAELMQRLIDPNDFVVLQDLMFASFNTVDVSLLGVAALVIGAATLATARLLPTLDVLALGRDTAISLGIAHRRTTLLVLALCALFVAVSTALVGPVTFFGLLVASLARSLVGSRRHAVMLLAASLCAVIALVGGQTILERGLGYNSALGMVVEFAGGIVFLALLLKKGTA
ncbi:iron chelate uptake ABC transporter family permease subunit [Fulvimarina pelagi]|nr:iron chelate uptake ABC transporter family permease subunit [Fulvimarina pelagi]